MKSTTGDMTGIPNHLENPPPGKETVEKKKKGKVPHIYVILFLMTALVSLASYVIPAGQFERVEGPTGAQIIQPGTFSFIEATPVSFFDFLLAIPKGLIEASEIVFGTLMIGGMFGVISRTGIIDLGVNKLAHRFSDKGIWIIPLLMVPFAIFTTFTGQVELSLVYLPIVLPLILRLGFDKITAAAIVLISTIAGFGVALTAPANLGVAQRVAEVPLYSGMGLRAVILTIILLTGIVYVWRYAKKVQANPVLAKNEQLQLTAKQTQVPKASKRQLVASVVLLSLLGVMIYGMIVYKWYFLQLSGLYILIAVTVGLIAGLSSSQISEGFTEGFQNILVGALIIGIARGISVALNDGNILDTIVYGISELLNAVPEPVTAVFMLLVQGLFNFLVPSGSGQALITMPIMTGLADLAGVTRQTAVLAFQLGDGFSNIFYPTSGYFMATLALGGIRWEKWIRFILPLLILWYTVGAIFLVIAQLMNWGPI